MDMDETSLRSQLMLLKQVRPSPQHSCRRASLQVTVCVRASWPPSWKTLMTEQTSRILTRQDSCSLHPPIGMHMHVCCANLGGLEPQLCQLRLVSGQSVAYPLQSVIV